MIFQLTQNEIREWIGLPEGTTGIILAELYNGRHNALWTEYAIRFYEYRDGSLHKIVKESIHLGQPPSDKRPVWNSLDEVPKDLTKDIGYQVCTHSDCYFAKTKEEAKQLVEELVAIIEKRDNANYHPLREIQLDNQTTVYDPAGDGPEYFCKVVKIA